MRERLSSVAASGVVALVFLVLGFQAALFMGNVFKNRGDKNEEGEKEEIVTVVANAEKPNDTSPADVPANHTDNTKIDLIEGVSMAISDKAKERTTDYSDSRVIIADKLTKKKVEFFPFDPNLISAEELQRLGFSEKQAGVIINYRTKGGKFRTKNDFAKMYVVDSVKFSQLEPYIQISKIDINLADSSTLTQLKGIGPYYAKKIIEYRNRLGGSFSSLEQLLEIEGIDADRYEGFVNDAEIKNIPYHFDLWSATEQQLERHPYIGSYAAKGIIRYKALTDSSLWNLTNLVSAGIIKQSAADKLSR